MPGRKRDHYRGDYPGRALAVRTHAYSRPDHRCAVCGLTLAEAQHKWGHHVRWDAGHVVDGRADSLLVAECSHCNRSKGAHRGNARRRSGYDW